MADNLLQIMLQKITNPLVPQKPVDHVANMIDHPSLDRSPMEARLAGFGAGALQGARTLTSPLNLASFAFPPARAAQKYASMALDVDALPVARRLEQIWDTIKQGKSLYSTVKQEKNNGNIGR